MTVLNAYTVLLTLLTLKHYVADIPLQTNWMAFNKGKFLHPGGLVHAGIHAIGTAMVLALAFWAFQLNVPDARQTIALIAVAEWVIHYFIDFTKMNIDKSAHLSELVYDGKILKGRLIINKYYYWSLVGDQCLHFLTYIAIGWLFLSLTVA